MRFISQFLIISLMASTCLAAPMGGEVIRGSSDISYDPSRVEINQHTDRAVIDWRSFDVKAGEHVKFNLPNPSSVALNRINDTKTSEINGLVSSNGNLILLNPNGIIFGKDAVIDAAGIIASSSKVNIDEFMNGGAFGFSADRAGKIINKGKISAKDNGLVGLVSPHLENHGIISAKLGKVHLASSDSYTVDLAGDGLINLAISDQQKQKIENNGEINAYKGRILLTASAAREIIDSLIINNGTIEAKTGSIKIYAEGANAVPDNVAANKGIKAGQSTISNNGIIDASGKKLGQKGGTIEVLADDIALLDNSKIDASGHTGSLGTYQDKEKSAARAMAAGGDIKIGGDYLGSGNTPAARNIYVAPNAKIYADSLDQGDAGRVTVWADKQNDFYGNVFARGGKKSGDGGFVETSGKEKLSAHGYVTTLAAKGKRGTYLLDPTSISIYGSTTGNWPKFKSTDGTVDLLTGNPIRVWLDASDTSTATLQFNSVSATLNANASGSTITSSTNLTSNTPVGSVIRVGAAGSNTAANSLDASTYVVQSVSWSGSQTTITLDKAVTGSSGNTIYAAYVSSWADKSGNSYNASQSTASVQPLWLSKGINNKGSAQFIASSSTYLNIAYMMGDLTNGFSYMFAYQDNSSSPCSRMFDCNLNTTNNVFFSPTCGSPRASMTITGNGGEQTVTFPTFTTNPALYDLYWGTSTAYSYMSSRQYSSSGVSLKPSQLGAVNHWIGKSAYVTDNYLNGTMGEILIYNNSLPLNNHNLLEQYRSVKWSIALNPLNNGHSEVVQATTDGGFSVFSTRYLERLAASADISLTAGSGGILLDLQGDTLTLPSEVNFGLTTTSNGNITSNSSGTIAATRTTSKGNITLSAGGTGAIDLNTSGAVSLTSSGGDISLTAGNNIKLYNVSGKTVTVNNNAAATADVYLNGSVTATSTSGNSIIVASGRNFINNVGSGVFTNSGTARYLVYSSNSANNTPVGTPASATSIYNTTYPTIPGTAGNLFIYSNVPTLIFSPTNQTVSYGNDIAQTAYTVSGYVNGDSGGYTGAPLLTSTTNTSSTIGHYANALSIALGTLVAGTYNVTVSGHADVDVVVPPTPLSIVPDNKFKFYNWPNPPLTYRVYGLNPGDPESLVSGITLTSTAVTGSLPGVYSITPSGGTVAGGTYAIQHYIPGTLTVTKTPPSNKCPCLTALGR